MAQFRKDKLQNGEIYHIFTRSIAKFIIFNNNAEFDRMFRLCDLYRYKDFNYKFSQLSDLTVSAQINFIDNLRKENNLLVKIIAYCLMPTHIHLILQQISDNGITKFMSKMLNSYSRYFNTKHKRIGPLWSGRFKSILLSSDEQLLHLTRYIHLNPVSGGLVNNLNKWEFSSYNEYINKKNENTICDFKTIIDMSSKQYKKFVSDRSDYQKKLSIIKSLMIDNYFG